MRAAVYVRISQDRAGGGLGVARQEDDCRALAESLGYEIAEVYCDNDVSAFSGKPRPEYNRMLADIRDGRVSAVICWHTDRLHRSIADLVTYMQIARDVPTHTVKSGLLDLSTANGRMVAVITGAVAQQESEHKSERQRRKADELASQGRPLGGGRPFGYEADGMTIRGSEADELRRMVARVLAGDSLAAILRDLNARGVVTTRGNQWGYTSLRSLLLRDRNCGRMRHRGEVVGRAAWEPVVSEADHDAVAALLADPARRTTTSPARRHLLSGLARCACGERMKPGWVKYANGRKHWIYACKVRAAGHAHRRMDRVDEYVVDLTLDVLGTVSRRADPETAALEACRRELEVKRDESALLYAAGQITASQLAAITAHLNGRLADVDGRLHAAVTSTVLDGVCGLSRAEWDELPLDRKRRIIDALMTITVEPLNGRRDVLGVKVRLRTSSGFGFTMPRDLERKLSAMIA